MSITPYRMSEWRIEFGNYKKTASVAFSNNSLVDWPASRTGYFVAATSSTTKLLGIIQKEVAAADADFALNSFEPILVPNVPRARVYATVASAAATDVGLRCDLTDASTVNNGASAVGRFLITGFVSATKVIGYFMDTALTAAA